MPTTPDWVRHAIWWQVYPLGFAGAADELDVDHPDRTDGLAKLVGWLDHLVALGGNGLLLGPVFSSMTHGYDTLDFRTVDPRLGRTEDLDALVAAAHERGIRVVLDGVFNHVGRDFPQVQQAIADGPESEAGRWLRWTTGVDGKAYPLCFEGHEQLVELNHDEPEVQQFVAGVLRHWLERGIDGWRLDATYTIPPEFWAAVLPDVRRDFGDAWFVGEMIHGEYADYVDRSGIDAVTEYELWAAVWHSLADTNCFELDWTLKRHADLVDRFLPLTFVSNHDVTRVASQIDDERHRDHAAVLLCFLPGTPSVYYGDEYGFEAVKEEREGGDDAIRPELPASPFAVQLSRSGTHTLELYRRLIAFRRRHPWLVDARIAPSEVSNTAITVTATPRNGDESPLQLRLNLADEALPFTAGETLESSDPVEGAVPPHGWAISTAG